MFLAQISIATITWARDENEETLLREALSELSRFNIPVYITDGGSSPAFLDFLRGFPQFTIMEAEKKGVWAQAGHSIAAAKNSGSDFILYTEPDKLDFFRGHLARLLEGISVNDNTGVVLATRSAKGFASFPSFQQMTETTINNCCAEIIKQQIDFTYGPFLMNAKLVNLIEDIDEVLGWGWRPLVFVLAGRLGYSVSGYEGDFFCPAGQRQDNEAERLYRMRQLEQNIKGIVMAASLPLK